MGTYGAKNNSTPLLVEGTSARDRDLTAYQTQTEWMGEPVLTLAALWPEQPRAMIVGLNPAPASVEVGHYYQGRSGQRQLLRLADAGLFEGPR